MASAPISSERQRQSLSPLPTRRRNYPKRLIAVALAIFVYWLFSHAFAWFMDRRWDAAAPPVLGEFEFRSFSCSLSPDGSFISPSSDFLPFGEAFVRTADNARVVVPRPAWAGTTTVRGTWLPDGRFFNYTSSTVADPNVRTRVMSNDVPQDGWIVDVAAATTVSLRDLPEAERAQVLATAREQLATIEQRISAGRFSPDGRYEFVEGAVREVGSGTVVVETRLPDIARQCSFGWASDSSGVYFVEMQRPPAQDIGARPGPIRFLKVTQE